VGHVNQEEYGHCSEMVLDYLCSFPGTTDAKGAVYYEIVYLARESVIRERRKSDA
jgi:hypothetical protein